MTLQTFLLILRARWWVSLALLVLVVTVAAVVTSLLPKRYTATASVIANVRATDPVNGVPQPMVLLPSYVATQVDVIKSDRVARRVIRSLDLNSDAAEEQWRAATGGVGSTETWLINALRRNLKVQPALESNVIKISFTGVDPRFAALLANAFTDAYIQTNLELRVDPARQYANFFGDRVRRLRQNLVRAQARLSVYQRENNLAGTNNYDVENARLADLSAQLVAAQGQRVATEARLRQTRGGASSSPDVLASPVVQQLRSDVARQSALLSELSSRLGPNHPQHQEAAAQLSELRARLDSEISQAASSVASTSRSDALREAELMRALEEQRQRVLAASAERDNLAVLQRDVESAQKSYEAVAQRLSQTQLESEIQQTDVSVLTPASEPLTPSSPNVILNLMLAFVVGGFLGLMAALAVEHIDRRIRSEADLGMPGINLITTLAATTRRRRWLPRLRTYSAQGAVS